MALTLPTLLEVVACLIGRKSRMVDKVGGDQVVEGIHVSLVPALVDDLSGLSFIGFHRHGIPPVM